VDPADRLQSALDSLAHEFAASVVAALRSATFAEVGELEGLPPPPAATSAPPREAAPPKGSAKERPTSFDLAEVERRTIVAALEATGNNRSKAAQLLGIPRSTLYNKLASGVLTARPRGQKRG